MTRFPERTQAAVLVVDAQTGVGAPLGGLDRVVAAIAEVVARARLAGVPVVWARRQGPGLVVGEPGWQLVDELVPEPGELQLDHSWDDAFIETGLAEALGTLDAGRLWLAGFGSDAGVLHTYLGALHRGFDVTLIEDAHAAAPADFDGCSYSASEIVGFVNRIVWRDLAPEVTGDLMAAANVEFAADEPDDDELIALAEAEVAADEAAELP